MTLWENKVRILALDVFFFFVFFFLFFFFCFFFCYLIFIFENTHQNKRIIHEDMKYIYNSHRHVVTFFYYTYLLT